jgi:hypothetical protein
VTSESTEPISFTTQRQTCAQCGSDLYTMKLIEPNQCTHPGDERPHFHVRCKVCRFIWGMYPKEASEEEKSRRGWSGWNPSGSVPTI